MGLSEPASFAAGGALIAGGVRSMSIWGRSNLHGFVSTYLYITYKNHRRRLNIQSHMAGVV